MERIKITLSALWIALMLTYLLGDVLRIFSGFNADPDYNDFIIPSTGLPSEPMGKHHRGRFIISRQCGWFTNLSLPV